MQKVYVSLKKDVHYHRSIQSTLIVVFCVLIFIVASFYMRSSFNDQREELIDTLRKEREVSQLNGKLKVELSGITRGRYIELKAKERLGLKKPKEEEVLVLTNE